MDKMKKFEGKAKQKQPGIWVTEFRLRTANAGRLKNLKKLATLLGDDFKEKA